LPSDNGHNPSYPMGQNSSSLMEAASAQLTDQWQPTAPRPVDSSSNGFGMALDQNGIASGVLGCGNVLPPGHPASPIVTHAKPPSGLSLGGPWPRPWPDCGQTRRYMAGLTMSVARARLSQQLARNATSLYVYADNNPITRVDPSGLYSASPSWPDPASSPSRPGFPTCPKPLCYSNTGKPLFSRLEICNAYIADPNTDKRGGAGVLCCGGHKYVCAFGPPDWPEYPGPGVCDELDKCIEEHEGQHFGDVRCVGQGLYRPDFRDPDREFARRRECHLRRETVRCLLRKGKFSGACFTAAEAIAEAEQDYINTYCYGIF
jgi:hypothetical protein